MQKVFAVLAALSLLFAIGSIGASEQGQAYYLAGLIQAVIGIVLFAVFTYLAKGFYGQEERRDYNDK